MTSRVKTAPRAPQLHTLGSAAGQLKGSTKIERRCTPFGSSGIQVKSSQVSPLILPPRIHARARHTCILHLHFLQCPSPQIPQRSASKSIDLGTWSLTSSKLQFIRSRYFHQHDLMHAYLVRFTVVHIKLYFSSCVKSVLTGWELGMRCVDAEASLDGELHTVLIYGGMR
jgi:hypothetical protein